MAEVVFEGVRKVFDGGAVAVDDLDLAIADGEFMVLVGPSGCGKTTALRMIAGLETPTAGRILIGGEDMTHRSPRDRDIAMVFQNYALYPHMTVQQNLAFGLRQRRTPKAEIAARVREVSELLQLDELLQRKPAQLSGGQRQRVAMGRALARHPRVFLLDEPLSNLDAKLRAELRAGLKRLHQQLGTTSIYVTHDQVEAMTLGQRVAVMSEGRLQQLAPPQAIYLQPANLFVAGFIGSPPMNILAGTARAGTIDVAGTRLTAAGAPDGDVLVGIRPEDLSPTDAADVPALAFDVDVVEPLGHETVVHGHCGEAPVIARLEARTLPQPGTRLRLGFPPEDVHLFRAADGERIGRLDASPAPA